MEEELEHLRLMERKRVYKGVIKRSSAKTYEREPRGRSIVGVSFNSVFLFLSSVSVHHVRNKLHPCDSERNQSKPMDAFYTYTI